MKAVTDFIKHRTDGRLISMVTVYDYTSARLVSDTPIDAVLVGDSAAMVMHGQSSTVHADIEMLAWHVAAVARGLGEQKVLIADIPFPWHRMGPVEALRAADKLFKAGATAVKIEGARGHLDVIEHLVGSGVPVMGHLGLTPQSVHQLGGYKVQARSDEARKMLIEDAHALQQAGCFGLVLECIPADLAKQVTEGLLIPTIGIGSGADCSGQVLVWQDLLGMNVDFKPRFVRTFTDGATLIKTALKDYHDAVVAGGFPSKEESFL